MRGGHTLLSTTPCTRTLRPLAARTERPRAHDAEPEHDPGARSTSAPCAEARACFTAMASTTSVANYRPRHDPERAATTPAPAPPAAARAARQPSSGRSAANASAPRYSRCRAEVPREVRRAPRRSAAAAPARRTARCASAAGTRPGSGRGGQSWYAATTVERDRPGAPRRRGGCTAPRPPRPAGADRSRPRPRTRRGRAIHAVASISTAPPGAAAVRSRGSSRTSLPVLPLPLVDPAADAAERRRGGERARARHARTPASSTRVAVDERRARRARAGRAAVAVRARRRAARPRPARSRARRPLRAACARRIARREHDDRLEATTRARTTRRSRRGRPRAPSLRPHATTTRAADAGHGPRSRRGARSAADRPGSRSCARGSSPRGGPRPPGGGLAPAAAIGRGGAPTRGSATGTTRLRTTPRPSASARHAAPERARQAAARSTAKNASRPTVPHAQIVTRPGRASQERGDERRRTNQATSARRPAERRRCSPNAIVPRARRSTMPGPVHLAARAGAPRTRRASRARTPWRTPGAHVERHSAVAGHAQAAGQFLVVARRQPHVEAADGVDRLAPPQRDVAQPRARGRLRPRRRRRGARRRARRRASAPRRCAPPTPAMPLALGQHRERAARRSRARARRRRRSRACAVAAGGAPRRLARRRARARRCRAACAGTTSRAPARDFSAAAEPSAATSDARHGRDARLAPAPGRPPRACAPGAPRRRSAATATPSVKPCSCAGLIGSLPAAARRHARS